MIALVKKITIVQMLVGLIYFFSVEIVAQEQTGTKITYNKTEVNVVQDTIYNTWDIVNIPKYIGGMEAFYKFIAQNYLIPEEVLKENNYGKVYITFIVEKDGTLTNFNVIRDIGYGTGDEAIRVLTNSPKWIPGKVEEKPVRVRYSLPIKVVSN